MKQENRRILAVDDDPLLLATYKKLLDFRSSTESKQLGGLMAQIESRSATAGRLVRKPFQLDCFSQGGDAVAAVEDAVRGIAPYAVALVDMRMPPGIDGLETVRRMRAVDPSIQIIIVTAHSDHTSDHISEMVNGQVLWFRKPFQSNELYQAVHSCCVSWNQEFELLALRADLAQRVELQTSRLQKKVDEMELMHQNTLSCELLLRDQKSEIRYLKAYQELRMLLSQQPLPELNLITNTEERVYLLLVDHSAERAAQHQQLMEQIGFQIVIAETLQEGFRKATTYQPDLMLIEPELSSAEVQEFIYRLQQHRRTKRVLPLLMIETGDELKALHVGAAYCIHSDESEAQFRHKMALIYYYLHQSKVELERYQLQADSHFRSQLEGENRRVLLVDDEEGNLDLLRMILGGEEIDSSVQRGLDVISDIVGKGRLSQEQAALSFELTACLQGQEAVEAVRQSAIEESPYAVALIDMRMPPGIDGLETARQIRQITPDIEIVMVTAYSDYSLTEIQQVLGLNFSFMVKPFSSEMVLQRVVEGCSKWGDAHKVEVSHVALLNLAEDMEEEIVHRREVEKKLERASHTKDEFLSSMSHELRTPLTTMIGYSELMTEEEDMPAQYREMAESSLLAGKTLLQLVNDILDMSKIRSGKFELNEHPFDLRKMASDVNELMMVFGAQKGVMVELEIDPALESHLSHCWVGDDVRISQILFNLLSNAVKFSDGGKQVMLHIEEGQQLKGRGGICRTSGSVLLIRGSGWIKIPYPVSLPHLSRLTVRSLAALGGLDWASLSPSS